MAEMRLVVVGAAGRMGRMLVKTVAETDGCKLVGALERPGSIALGEDAGLLAGVAKLVVPIGDDPRAALKGAEGLIDFTAPAATVALARLAAEAGLVHVIGTTGLTEPTPTSFARRRPAPASFNPAICASGSTCWPGSSARWRKPSARISTSRSSRCTTA